jgi:hypothetical protein
MEKEPVLLGRTGCSAPVARVHLPNTVRLLSKVNKFRPKPWQQTCILSKQDVASDNKLIPPSRTAPQNILKI